MSPNTIFLYVVGRDLFYQGPEGWRTIFARYDLSWPEPGAEAPVKTGASEVDEIDRGEDPEALWGRARLDAEEAASDDPTRLAVAVYFHQGDSSHATVSQYGLSEGEVDVTGAVRLAQVLLGGEMSDDAPSPEGLISSILSRAPTGYPSRPAIPVLEVYLDPGDASPETIAEFYAALSDLHRAYGGTGLELVEGDVEAYEFDGEER